MEEILTPKARCRAAIKNLRFSDEEKRQSDALIQNRLLHFAPYQAAESIFLYVSFGFEIDTLPILEDALRRGKVVAVPLCQGGTMEARRIGDVSQLRPGRFTLDPPEDAPVLSRDAIDLIVVPGLAFDRKGHRLGRGGGFYDRYLAGYQGRTVALCRTNHLLFEVPVEAHDRSVDAILTEQETVNVCLP